MHHSKFKSLEFSELVFIIFEFLKFHLKFQEVKLWKKNVNFIVQREELISCTKAPAPATKRM